MRVDTDLTPFAAASCVVYPRESLAEFRDRIRHRRSITVDRPGQLFTDDRLRTGGRPWTRDAFRALCRRLGPGVFRVVGDTLGYSLEDGSRLVNELLRQRFSRLAGCRISCCDDTGTIDDFGTVPRSLCRQTDPAWGLPLASDGGRSVVGVILCGAEATAWVADGQILGEIPDIGPIVPGWRWHWCGSFCHLPRLAPAVVCPALLSGATIGSGKTATHGGWPIFPFPPVEQYVQYGLNLSSLLWDDVQCLRALRQGGLSWKAAAWITAAAWDGNASHSRHLRASHLFRALLIHGRYDTVLSHIAGKILKGELW